MSEEALTEDEQAHLNRLSALYREGKANEARTLIKALPPATRIRIAALWGIPQLSTLGTQVAQKSAEKRS